MERLSSGTGCFTLVLIIAAALTFVSALLYRENERPRPDLRWLTCWPRVRHPASRRHWWDHGADPAQSVRGGAAFAAVDGSDRTRSLAGAEDLALHAYRCIGRVGRATRVTFVLMWLAVWLGTLVTGSGPHAGDENVPRNGLDGMLLTRLHSSMVYATVAASMICFLLLRSRAALLSCWSSCARRGSVWRSTSWACRFGWWPSTFSALRSLLRPPPTCCCRCGDARRSRWPAWSRSPAPGI